MHGIRNNKTNEWEVVMSHAANILTFIDTKVARKAKQESKWRSSLFWTSLLNEALFDDI